ncbi:MAG: GNAT family N-acetyltransferase [Chitinophagaceae bacterium]|nr:MAG: GNAT family N-acetyltransferase [Chitinophagaceae bacterium]
MEIVSATPLDMPAMIALLKKSLGESLMPKSEGFFNWKHYENPFGRSMVLLAKENEEVIGLRAFMRWEWMRGGEKVTAVRAVDTATDPSHQGKGIFKKLTLQAVADCKAEGVGIVFNSPNASSRPGYLKMGWKDAGRMPLWLKPGSIIPAKYNEENVNSHLEHFSISKVSELLQSENEFPSSKKFFHTPLSPAYIHWRYSHCPVVKYGAVAAKGSFGIIFRVKKLKAFSELRICEMWSAGPAGEKEMMCALKTVVNKFRPLMVSCAPTPLISGKAGFFGPFQKGPITTIRELHLTQLNDFENFNAWRPSIGSLELF